MDYRQERFEKWVMEDSVRPYMLSLATQKDGEYTSPLTDYAWRIWVQAWDEGTEA